MTTRVFVINQDDGERRWIQAALAQRADEIVVMDDGTLFLAAPPTISNACLITTAEPDDAATLRFVRELREHGVALPVIVLGSHSAFRVAVDIARLPATNFLERPISATQLRAAVTKALKGAA